MATDVSLSPLFFLLNTGLFFVARLKVEGVIGRNEEETVGAVVSLSLFARTNNMCSTRSAAERERGARQVEACNSFLPFRPSLAGRRERNYRTYFTVGIFQTSGNWRRSRSKEGKTPEDVADIAQGMCTVCSVYTHRRRNLNNEREEE